MGIKKGNIEKGTIYHLGAIEIIKTEARDIEWDIGEYAQYANGIIISCIPKRKQYPRIQKFSESNIVIFDGWGHIQPPSFGVTTNVNIGVLDSVTEWELSKDSIQRNKKAFSNYIDNYLKSNASKLVIDFRVHKVKTKY